MLLYGTVSCCLRLSRNFLSRPRSFFLRSYFGRMILAELRKLFFIFIFEYLRLAWVDTRWECDSLLSQRVHGSTADLFIQPDITAKTAIFALNLLFSFIRCHPLHLLPFGIF